jgi:hypothetical protein
MSNNETKYKYTIDFNQIQHSQLTDIRDPMDEEFNWWYWCGFQNKEKRTKAIREYDIYKSQLPQNFYKIFQGKNSGEMRKLKNALLVAGIKGGVKDEYINKLFKSMKTISRDIPRSLTDQLTLTDRIYEICINVMFLIESNRLKRNINNSYIQGECFFFMQIVKMLLEDERVTDQEIECLVFYISTTLYSNMTIKQTIYSVPDYIDNMPTDEKYIYKIPPYIYIQWLFMVMFIKKNKNKFKKLINNKDQKKIDDMFSESVSTMSWHSWIVLISYLDTSVFREIIGNVLVSKDPTMYFAYMIAFFCGYKNTTGVQFDDITSDNQIITMPTTDENAVAPHLNLQLFWMNNFTRTRIRELAKQSLTDINDDFNSLCNYFRENFEKLTLMCTRKSFINRTVDSEGTYKWNFKLPREFIKNRKIWDIKYSRPIHEEKVAHITAIARGGRKKRKKRKKYKTIKKSNRKLNRTIKLR